VLKTVSSIHIFRQRIKFSYMPHVYYMPLLIYVGSNKMTFIAVPVNIIKSHLFPHAAGLCVALGALQTWHLSWTQVAVQHSFTQLSNSCEELAADASVAMRSTAKIQERNWHQCTDLAFTENIKFPHHPKKDVYTLFFYTDEGDDSLCCFFCHSTRHCRREEA
jgi:hypothetical protein